MQVNKRRHTISPRATPRGHLVSVTESEVTSPVAAGCLQGDALHWARRRDLHGSIPRGKRSCVKASHCSIHSITGVQRGQADTHRSSSGDRQSFCGVTGNGWTGKTCSSPSSAREVLWLAAQRQHSCGGSEKQLQNILKTGRHESCLQLLSPSADAMCRLSNTQSLQRSSLFL